MKTAKKSSKIPTGGNCKRIPVGGNMSQTPRPNSSQSARTTPNLRPSKKDDYTGAPQSNSKFLRSVTFVICVVVSDTRVYVQELDSAT